MATSKGKLGGLQSSSIIEGLYQETYTPTAGRIVSPALGKTLKFCKMMPIATGSITWRDQFGNQNTAELPGGTPYPFFVSEISDAASGVIIVHDGEIDNRFA